MDKSLEDVEKIFEALAEAVSETVESIGEILSPGERFALHPMTFVEAEEYDESLDVLEGFIVDSARRQLGILPGMAPARTGGGETFYKTNQPNTFLGTDGEAWWIEIFPEEENEGISAEIQRGVSGDLARVSDVGLPKTERLARLREAKEVVEDKMGLREFYMHLRSDMPLTRRGFIQDFPHAKALVITAELLWTLEASFDEDRYFSYITAAGKRKYLRAEEMEEPLVLFLEDLGD